MGRVRVVNFVSIDGVIQSPLSPEEDPDGGFARGGWVLPYGDELVEGVMRDTTVAAAGLLLGRRTYEILYAAWAQADESDPAVAAMNRMPKHVVSSAPGDLAWSPSHRVAGDLCAAVEALKRDTEGDLLVLGSATLVRGLAERDLVDEYRLLLFPVLLGAGKRMFGDRSHPSRLTLTETVVSPLGVAIHTFVRDPGG